MKLLFKFAFTVFLIFLLNGCNLFDSEKVYTITFVDHNDEIIEVNEKRRNEDIIPPLAPEITGYTFVGWDRPLFFIMSDVTIKAQYRANIYNVYLDYGEGLKSESIAVKFKSNIDNLPGKNRNLYYLAGWELDGVEIEFPYFFNYPNDITLKAIWVDVWEEGLFSEVNDFFVKLDTWFIDSNNFRETLNIELSVDDLKTWHELNIVSIYDISNNYLEIKYTGIDNMEKHSVFQIVGDKAYKDVIFAKTDSPSMVRREYLGSADDFISLEPNYSQIFTEDMKYKKINDNHYKMEILFSQLDYINSNDLLEILGLSYNEAKNKKFLLEFHLDEIKNELKVIMEYTEKKIFNSNTITQRYKFHITYDMMGLNSMLDLTTPDYEYYLPECFDTVDLVTDITEPISTDQAPRPHFYKVYFESGQYLIEIDYFHTNLPIKIYNLDRTQASISQLISSKTLGQNSSFVINEGYYYIEVGKNLNLYNGYRFSFVKMDFNTIFDFENPYPLTEKVNGIIEGKYDAEIYSFYSDSDGILIFYNMSPVMNIVARNYDSNSFYVYHPINGNVLIPVRKGINYICTTYNERINYSFDTKIFYDTITPTDFENMTSLTEHYSEHYIVVGYRNTKDYYRLDVSESGTYILEFEKAFPGSRLPYIHIYRSDGTIITQNQIVDLEVGTYYVMIDANDHIPCVIRARFKKLVDEEVVHEFEVTDYDRKSPIYTVIEGTINTAKSVIYHQFTLTEPSTILIINYSHYQLLNEDNEDLYVSFPYPIRSISAFYELPAGTYRIRVFRMGNISYPASYNFQIARLLFEFEDDFDERKQIPTVSLDELVFIQCDYIGDKDILKFHAQESLDYFFYLKRLKIYIYDKDWNYIGAYGNPNTNTTQTYKINLDAGSYYLVSFADNKYITDVGSLLIKDRFVNMP